MYKYKAHIVNGEQQEPPSDFCDKAGAKAADMVNHPPHYTSDPSGVECIQITEHRNFCIGNAIKYLWRNGLKEGESDVKDLKKAVWYINREIERIERIEKEENKPNA